MHSFVYASLAQSVEHAAVNRGVVGSSPTGGATFNAVKLFFDGVNFPTDVGL